MTIMTFIRLNEIVIIMTIMMMNKVIRWGHDVEEREKRS